MIELIIVFVLVCLLIAMFIIDRYNDYIGTFIFALFALVILSMYVGWNDKQSFEIKKQITPSIKIECVDGKCDTTYIYKFNNNK
jgi:amino acid permease